MEYSNEDDMMYSNEAVFQLGVSITFRNSNKCTFGQSFYRQSAVDVKISGITKTCVHHG